MTIKGVEEVLLILRPVVGIHGFVVVKPEVNIYGVTIGKGECRLHRCTSFLSFSALAREPKKAICSSRVMSRGKVIVTLICLFLLMIFGFITMFELYDINRIGRAARIGASSGWVLAEAQPQRTKPTLRVAAL